MGCSAALVLLVTGGLAISAPAPGDAETTAARDDDPASTSGRDNAGASTDAQVDDATRTQREDAAQGLRPVPFTPRAVPASTRAEHAPDLRDPFVLADRRPSNRQRAVVHEDLRDPFATHREDSPRPAPADLRDPFDRPPDPDPCPPTTTDDGVRIQRPEALKVARCPAAALQRGRIALR